MVFIVLAEFGEETIDCILGTQPYESLRQPPLENLECGLLWDLDRPKSE